VSPIALQGRWLFFCPTRYCIGFWTSWIYNNYFSLSNSCKFTNHPNFTMAMLMLLCASYFHPLWCHHLLYQWHVLVHETMFHLHRFKSRSMQLIFLEGLLWFCIWWFLVATKVSGQFVFSIWKMFGYLCNKIAGCEASHIPSNTYFKEELLPKKRQLIAEFFFK
jgi:hypothetical protein